MALNLLNEKATRSIARKYDIPEDFFCGVVDKESAGKFFWMVGGQKWPAIRPEAHYFYRILKKSNKKNFDAAVKAGLAQTYGKARVPGQPSKVYDIFNRMKAIDEEAAVQSISIGVGQIMGSHYKLLGFASAIAMWQWVVMSPVNQLELMAKFIVSNKKLHTAAKKYDYTMFAIIYNGKGYKKNRYDTELKKHVLQYREVAAPKTKTIATAAAIGGGSVGIGGTIISSSQDAQEFVWGISPITDVIAMASENAANIVGAAVALTFLGFMIWGVYNWMKGK